MSLDYSRSSQTSYCKHEEEQHKTDENLLNLRVFQGTQLILQVFFSGVSASVERRAAEPPALFGRTHFKLHGGAVLPPHGRSLAEHGARPPLHTDKPIISWQSMPKILCHMEGTRVSVQSIVFCYNCTCQKIVGAMQLKGAYKKLMADINTNLQTKNGQKGRCKRSEI